MKKETEARLDVVSSISEEHVDAVTTERISASARQRKKLLLIRKISAVAAAFVIIVPTVLILIFALTGGQVPVYTGMTVSNFSPFAEESAYLAGEPLAAKDGIKAKKKPISDGMKEHFGIAKSELLYNAKQNEDIYITVKINNPENYEILSFTLNGKKYSSYMFEDGSDMENLVLKVNVGEAVGLLSYTIDAIKYVDGEKIKDVRMDGERTVKIGIYSENQPTSAISELSHSSSTVSAKINVFDIDAAVALGGGKFYAVLYDGEAVVSKKEISLGEVDVSFINLKAGEDYTLAVVAFFDAFDGQGVAPHLLVSEEFTAESGIYPTNINVVGNEVSFQLVSSNSSLVFTGLELIDWSGNTHYTSDRPQARISNLPGGRLTLRISYNYTENGYTSSGTSETVFWCAEGMLPIIGEVSFHYSNYPVSHPISGGYFTHKASELTATTDDLNVYSLSGGVVVEIQSYRVIYDEEDPTAPPTLIEGFIEILDTTGKYHLYRFVKDSPFKLGDTVKLGDKIGVLYTTGHILNEGLNLHYACSTLQDGVKVYHCPSFDTPQKSESEKLDDLLLANPILTEGLTVSGTYGETATVMLTFNTAAGNEKIVPDSHYLPSYATIEKIEDNVWKLTCDFSELRETEKHAISVTLNFGTFQTSWTLSLTFTPTDVPPIEGDGTEGDEGGEGDTPTHDPEAEISVSRALALPDGTSVKVKGTVCYVSTWNDSYDNCNATIRDSEGNVLYAYRLATKVALGDEVVITGVMSTYNEERQLSEGCTAEITVIHGDAHVYQDGLCTVCGGIEPSDEHVSISVNIADYAAANGWISNRKYTTLSADEAITVTASGGTNTGNYYSGNSSWVLYRNESATLTVSAAEGKTIVAVKISYTNSGGGTFILDEEIIRTDALTVVNADSVTLEVGNMGTSTSGQVKITSIEIIYK